MIGMSSTISVTIATSITALRMVAIAARDWRGIKVKRIFIFDKGKVTEDLVDTKMMDFLLDYLLGDASQPDWGRGGFPYFRDNFKVTITIEKIKGKKMFFKNQDIIRI